MAILQCSFIHGEEREDLYGADSETARQLSDRERGGLVAKE